MLKQFQRHLDRPQAFWLTVVGYTVSAVLQGLTFVVMVPFLRAYLGDDPASALPWLWLLLGLAAGAFLTQFLTLYRSHRVSVVDVCGNLIHKVGKKVAGLPLGWFNAATPGRVAALTSTQVNVLSHLGSIILPGLLGATVVPATVLVALLFVDWRMALVLAVAVPAGWLVWRWGLQVLRVEQEQEPRLAAASAGRLIEYAQLQPVLRARGLHGLAWQPLRRTLTEENTAMTRVLRLQGPPLGASALLAQALFAAVLAVGLWLLLGGSLDVATFLAVALLSTRFTTPLGQALLFQGEVQKAGIALQEMDAVLDEPELPDGDEPRQLSGFDIEFHDVGFSYEPGRPLLDGFSLCAPQGRITALVGPSGCGKSTCQKLVARFWDVDSGRITIGGVDVRELPTEQLMGMISMVFQDVYLFDTTILDNVRLARPDATDEEVAEAVRRARLDSMVARLPEGLQTRVGEGGLRLSGGERQRVSIARAFLKDSPILLLDEITSALDAENEALLTRTLAELSEGRTVVVIAHRLTTIMNADSVAVLSGREKGEATRIVEQGSPEELQAAGGLFAELVADSTAVSRWRLG
ncbi:MAG: ABC transporter ATP-binding protein [Propionibacteriaceae bacterium]|nr:ABC transporter ATP-binding protein [Propionibacteriaceae bacterium]